MICCGQPNTCERPCFHGGCFRLDAQDRPPAPSIAEQCEAAMGRLKAHISAHCAEHREAIRANSNWDIRCMHQRHNDYEADDGRLWGSWGLSVLDGLIHGFGLHSVRLDLGTPRITHIDPRSIWR